MNVNVECWLSDTWQEEIMQTTVIKISVGLACKYLVGLLHKWDIGGGGVSCVTLYLLISSNYFYSIILDHWDTVVKQPTAFVPQSFQKVVMVIIAWSGNECNWSLSACCKQNILKCEGQEVTWGLVMRYCAQLHNCGLTIDMGLLEGSCAKVTVSEQREDSDLLGRL